MLEGLITGVILTTIILVIINSIVINDLTHRIEDLEAEINVLQVEHKKEIKLKELLDKDKLQSDKRNNELTKYIAETGSMIQTARNTGSMIQTAKYWEELTKEMDNKWKLDL